MTPLLALGGMAAASVLQGIFSNRSVGRVSGYTPSNGSQKGGTADFAKTLASLTDQAAKTGADAAVLAAPLSAEARTSATQYLKTRQGDLSQELQKGVQSGTINDAQRQTVEKLAAQASGGIDSALSDGVLTLGEFKQATASLDEVAKQLTAYKLAQGKTAQNQSTPVNITV